VLTFALLSFSLLRSTAAWAPPKIRCNPSTLLNSQQKNFKNDKCPDRICPDRIVNFPFIAVITEADACHSRERMDETLKAIQSAVSSRNVALVSIRTSPPSEIAMQHFEEQVMELTRRVVLLSQSFPFLVVVSSDWVHAGIQAGAHGIHVKESHRDQIPEIRRIFPYPPIIGTSSHGVDSALDAWALFQPDYFFAGTCYATESHPEKRVEDLEGPGLPGTMKRALLEKGCTSPVLAIGGVDERNCDEPMRLGADGVATIRAVLQSKDPKQAVQSIHKRLT
jgi:thiamine-phosphate pyrophosphorylase